MQGIMNLYEELRWVRYFL